MGLPLLGLEAVFENELFRKGMADYMKAISGAESKTKTTATGLSGALAAVGKVAGTVFTAVGGVALAGAGAIAGAAVAGIKAVGDWAETVDGVGDVLGTTARESSALAVAIKGVGGNVDGITSQMAFLTRGLVDAKGELGPTGEAMQKLGIQFRGTDGKLLSSAEILSNVANVVGNMPDGLDKTRIMMSLFGKSGKDLSDVMGALANGGLAAADAKAKALGLSLSDEAAAGAIEFGRQMETLKMAGQGLAVAIGTQLLPMLLPLIQKLTELAIQAMPQVVAAIQVGAAWMQANLFPVLQQVYDWLAVNLPPALFTLSQIWQYVLLPAIQAVGWLIGNVIVPLLNLLAGTYIRNQITAAQQWGDIYNTYLLPAIQALTTFWSTVMFPALQAVWNFLNTSLFPLFRAFADFLAAVFNLVSRAAAGIWQNVLLPALTAVWGFLNKNVFPIFREIAKFLGEIFGPVITKIAGFIRNLLVSAFSALVDIISRVITKLRDMADFLNHVRLPDWMTPGSPTPWEIGLVGVDAALKELTRVSLPALQLQMERVGAPALYSQASAGFTPAATTNNNYNNSWNFAPTINNGMDLASFRQFIIQTVREAI